MTALQMKNQSRNEITENAKEIKGKKKKVKL